MIYLPVSRRTFESVEQLDALPRELGWPLEYRQMEPGPFSSSFVDVEGDGWFLMEEQSSRRVEVQAAAPEGMFMVALAEGDPAVINGKYLGADQILLQTPDSDIRASLPAGVKAIQVGIFEEQFEAVLRAVAPGVLPPRGNIEIFNIASDQAASLRWTMRAALFAPSMREAIRDEAASRILADLVTTAFAQGQQRIRRDLHRAGARRALDKAREYIEANVTDQIRVETLCSYSGTSLRSLQRIFAREMGVSPQQYVIARRLNAVRRRLVAADQKEELRITDVAHDHGFVHLGRFANVYRRYFGESPRETLQAR